MPAKKDNLPISVDVDLDNGGTIKYANEVIAIIAGVAAGEVDGIAGMCTSGGIADIIGRNRSITRGVKVEIGSQEAGVELYIIVEYGSPIQKVASEVQENVRKAIETMTGLHVVSVDVHVQGVSFEREKRALQSGLESAHLSAAETAKIESDAREALRDRSGSAQGTGESAQDSEDAPQDLPDQLTGEDMPSPPKDAPATPKTPAADGEEPSGETAAQTPRDTPPDTGDTHDSARKTSEKPARKRGEKRKKA